MHLNNRQESTCIGRFFRARWGRFFLRDGIFLARLGRTGNVFYDALKKAGVETTFYTVRSGGHGGFRDPEVNRLVATFFAQHLKP